MLGGFRAGPGASLPVPTPRMYRSLKSLLPKTPAVIVAAGVVGGNCLALVDAYYRARLHFPMPAPSHWLGVVALYSAVGGGLGLVAVLLVLLARKLENVAARRLSARWTSWVLPVVFGLALMLASIPVSLWTFSGKGIGQTVWAHIGPPVFVLCILVMSALWTRWLALATREGGRARRWHVALVAVPLGIALTRVDHKVFVSLYDRLHSCLEVTAFLVLGSAAGLGLDYLLRKVPRSALVTGSLAGIGVFGAVLAVSSAWARDAVDRALPHAWVDPVYAGRMLRRIEELKAYLADPAAYDGIAMGRLGTLRERYQLADITLAEAWLAPPAPAKESSTRQRLSEAGLALPNVLVFYIDTLRYDVARDPKVMPNLARFARESLDFRRAYATGSDTLRSLPGLTGGSYFLRHTHPGDLCDLARASDHVSSLFIARSAHEFLLQLRPTFVFEQQTEIADFDTGREVWGYGADRPTAERIVDGAIERLRSRPDEKFFMWLFNFDQHNWRELNEDFVQRVMQEHKVPEAGAYSNRYRAVATAIDVQFGRMLDALEASGHADDTVVLLVSDHGEGLGDGGFWVHSVFLWESLIHVPLLMRVPGVAPRAVDEVVSLVDVAPTLARFLVPNASIRGYHGEDLLLYADPEPAKPTRRFPVMFGAALRDELVRVGMIEDGGRGKLVVRLEAAQAELHDLFGALPDDVDLADDEPERARKLLRMVAKSPVFPREIDDFRMLNPKGNLSLESTQATLPVSAGH